MTTPTLSDVGNGKRLVARHGANLRYCYPWGKWLAWDGCKWRSDDTGEVERLAKGTVAAMYMDAASLADDERRALLKHALATESRAPRIKAMIDLARSEPGIAVLPEQLDRDPWLLNCANGTLNLRTGELRTHERANLLTKLCPVEYDTDANTCIWNAFLQRVFAGDSELIAFVQRLLGYCLTGDVREQVLPILWGTGANGKSTLITTALEMLGDYGHKAPAELLLEKREPHPTERADLHGRRLVACSESDDGRRLAESLVKELTGGDTVSARRMREDFWTYRPTQKLILATNHKPVVRGTDHAMWRRLRLVPFTVTIPDAEQDKTLPDRLRAELPGILAWCVAGCLEWQCEGLGMPDAVQVATADYRTEQDVLGSFVGECCVTGSWARVRASALYAAYQDWAQRAGERTVNQTRFGGAVQERGFTRRASNGVWYLGIGLATDRTEGTEGTEGFPRMNGQARAHGH